MLLWGSIPIVVRHIFQACPVWIYTQSNITSIIFTWVHYTNTEKIMTIRTGLLCPEFWPFHIQHFTIFDYCKRPNCLSHYWMSVIYLITGKVANRKHHILINMSTASPNLTLGTILNEANYKTIIRLICHLRCESVKKRKDQRMPMHVHHTPLQGPVVQKPINANLGLNLLNLGLNFNPRLLCVVQS